MNINIINKKDGRKQGKEGEHAEGEGRMKAGNKGRHHKGLVGNDIMSYLLQSSIIDHTNMLNDDRVQGFQILQVDVGMEDDNVSYRISQD